MDADKLHRRIINAWCMYDWANSAFATTIMAALLPPYFSNVAAAGLPKAQASAIWGYGTSLAMIVAALLGPVLGAIADYTGSKKRFLFVFAAIGVLFSGLLALIGQGDWIWAVLLFVLAEIGFSGANVFYDSLLPHVARPDELDRVSTRGYAMGYLGGGILLAINIVWYLFPETFGFADSGAAVRASFLSVAVWWAVFSLPLFRHVPEPATAVQERGAPVREAFQRLARTFGEIKKYRQLSLFLVAYWVYADGIGTIMKMATVYGAEIGIDTGAMAGALLLTQFVGIPLTLLFGQLPKRIGTRQSIYLALLVYAIICIGGYFMTVAWHFWVLAGLVGTVQGGSQALSRSLFGAMCPKNRSAEFFGFFDISSKFAGIAGPLLFAVAGTLAGGSRVSIVSLIVFFVVGAVLLSRVDDKEGIAVAAAENAAASALAVP
jgi:UMF1 family MFS transporter